MNVGKLPSKSDLPRGFDFPRQFQHLLELGLVNLEPWHILTGDNIVTLARTLAKMYPTRVLTPFARRQDNDDIVCWEGSDSTKVYLIHMFADPGWEQRGVFPTLYDWLRQAVEDLIEFDT
jgi:hypothetical protein